MSAKIRIYFETAKKKQGFFVPACPLFILGLNKAHYQSHSVGDGNLAVTVHVGKHHIERTRRVENMVPNGYSVGDSDLAVTVSIAKGVLNKCRELSPLRISLIGFEATLRHIESLCPSPNIVIERSFRNRARHATLDNHLCQ